MPTIAPSLNAAYFRSLSPTEQNAFLDTLSEEEAYQVLYAFFEFWARPDQTPPSGSWFIWMLDAGRGTGKTRTGAEWINLRVEREGARRINLVGRTKPDVYNTMLFGESGIFTCARPDFMPILNSTRARVDWPNGASALIFSADEPNQLTGPQCDTFWGDELAGWRQPVKLGEKSAWDNLLFGARLRTATGGPPKGVITTTPKATELFRKVKKMADVVTRATTYDNRDNLAPAFFTMLRAYEGTRLGRQELLAEDLDDNPDALWSSQLLDQLRRSTGLHSYRRITVGVDPEAVSTLDSAETGIVVCGRGYDNHLYTLADYTVRGTPGEWGAAAVRAYHDFKANRMVGEVNNGGEMVQYVIETVDPSVVFKAVRASRGKLVRAEPVAALAEKRRAHMVGSFPDLEAQLTQWMPGERSPDRLDAYVWAATDLMFGGKIGRGRPTSGTAPPEPWGARIPGVS